MKNQNLPSPDSGAGKSQVPPPPSNLPAEAPTGGPSANVPSAQQQQPGGKSRGIMDYARSGLDKARSMEYQPPQVQPPRQFAPNTPWSPNFAQQNQAQHQNPNFGTLRMPEQFMQAPQQQYRPQFNMSNKNAPMPPFQGMGQGMGPRPMPPQAQPMPPQAQAQAPQAPAAEPRISAVQAYRNRFR